MIFRDFRCICVGFLGMATFLFLGAIAGFVILETATFVFLGTGAFGNFLLEQFKFKTVHNSSFLIFETHLSPFLRAKALSSITV